MKWVKWALSTALAALVIQTESQSSDLRLIEYTMCVFVVIVYAC